MDAMVGTHVRLRIENLIMSSKKSLLLISPYIEPWKRLEQLVQNAQSRGVQVVIIARGGSDLEKQKRNTESLRRYGVKVGYLERLHAKVYVSESTAILTSMNLLRSSQEGSWEAAVEFKAAQDPTNYKKIAAIAMTCVKELGDQAKREKHLEALSQGHEDLAETVRVVKDYGNRRASAVGESQPRTRRKQELEGACIRCSLVILYNPEKPLCGDCYKTWAKFSNEDYEESYCHGCAADHATSIRKPLCRSCFRKGP